MSEKKKKNFNPFGRRQTKKFHPKNKGRKKVTKTQKEQIEAENLQNAYKQKIDLKSVQKFNQLPLSGLTLKGLKEAGFEIPTEIQKQTLLLSLKGIYGNSE